MKPVLTNRCAERVIAHVSARSGVATADILGRSRRAPFVRTRHRVVRLLTRLGYARIDIAAALGRAPSVISYVIHGGRA